MICSLRASLIYFLLAGISVAFKSNTHRRHGSCCAQHLTIGELTADVIDRPVTIKRPDILKNTYFGLRHGALHSCMTEVQFRAMP